VRLVNKKFQGQQPMPNQETNLKKQGFDLLERTSNLGAEIIRLCKQVPLNSITNPIVSQIVRSGTSIGANYAEANEANSKKDFLNKICITRKESKETLHWIKMLVTAYAPITDSARLIYKEVHEIILIFSAINSKGKKS
jgi:four helix bundle protein